MNYKYSLRILKFFPSIFSYESECYSTFSKLRFFPPHGISTYNFPLISYNEKKLNPGFEPVRKTANDSKINLSDVHQLPNLETFNTMYHNVLKTLTHGNISTTISKRIGQIVDYTIPDGKKNRGLTVVLAYNMLSGSPITSENMKLPQILGWCVEILQGFLLIFDDLMDQGILRRGKPCWYRNKNIGLEAINDALMLECAIYQLLKVHFSELSCYTRILEEFHEVTQKTAYGQCLDMAANPSNMRPLFEKFDLNYYNSIVELKTSHYTYCLPVNLAMHLIGGFNDESYKVVRDLCLRLGYLFQMQDDYLDVYGTSNTGKIGSDIKGGKCTWFAVTAIENSTEPERSMLKENYGIADEQAVKKVLDCYEKLSLKKRYIQMEENIYSEVQTLITKLDERTLNKELFQILLKNIYKREK